MVKFGYQLQDMYSQDHIPDHSPIERFFEDQKEPVRSSLQVLRELILGLNEHMSMIWKYDVVFFCFHDLICCSLRVDRHTGKPCIVFAEHCLPDHRDLIKQDDKGLKKLIISPEADIDLDTIEHLLGEMIRLAEEKLQVR